MLDIEISNEAKLPTPFGEFNIRVFKSNNKEHLVLYSKEIPEVPLVRIHSECLTGDVFGSLKCDCGDELKTSMQRVSKSGGMIIYLRQEGRGIGLLNKINAYALQDRGMDTVEANLALGFRDDERSYEILDHIFKYFNLTSIKLITNNPKKIEDVSELIKVQRESIIVESNCYNKNYLKTKKDKLGHLI